MQGNNKQNKTWLKAAITAIAPFLLIGCMSSVNNNEAEIDSRNSQISEFVNTREAETEQQQIPPTSKTELTNQYTHLPSTSSELKAYANNLEWEDGSKKTFSKLHRCSTDYSQMPYSHNIKTELRELEDKLKELKSDSSILWGKITNLRSQLESREMEAPVYRDNGYTEDANQMEIEATEFKIELTERYRQEERLSKEIKALEKTLQTRKSQLHAEHTYSSGFSCTGGFVKINDPRGTRTCLVTYASLNYKEEQFYASWDDCVWK